jgi:hypothetical protein
MQSDPQGMWTLMDDWFSQRSRRNNLKRNNFTAAENEDSISKKLSDSMMERVFDKQQADLDKNSAISSVSKRSLQSIQTKVSRRGIFDEPGYYIKKEEERKAIAKKLYEMKAFNPIATPRLVDSKQIFKRKNLEDFPDHQENSQKILRLNQTYNNTATDRNLSSDAMSQRSKPRHSIKDNLMNHLEKRKISMNKPLAKIEKAPNVDAIKTIQYYMESLDQMAKLEIDPKVLQLFKITLSKEFEAFTIINDTEFHKQFYNSFNQSETNDQAYEVIRSVCFCESDPAQISLEKLANFVALYQVHPLLKKGDNFQTDTQVLPGALAQVSKNSKNPSPNRAQGPLTRDHDAVLWQEKVQGSTEQKNFRARKLTGGSISPVKEGGLAKYSSYCQTLTHGLPSGEGQDDKKMVRLGVAGGDMERVITNTFFKEGLQIAEYKDKIF